MSAKVLLAVTLTRVRIVPAQDALHATTVAVPLTSHSQIWLADVVIDPMSLAAAAAVSRIWVILALLPGIAPYMAPARAAPVSAIAE